MLIQEWFAQVAQSCASPKNAAPARCEQIVAENGAPPKISPLVEVHSHINPILSRVKRYSYLFLRLSGFPSPFPSRVLLSYFTHLKLAFFLISLYSGHICSQKILF